MRTAKYAAHFEEGYPSGQRGQTVNLLAYAFIGSNPIPTTIFRLRPVKNVMWPAVFTFLLLSWHGLHNLARGDSTSTNKQTGPTLQLGYDQNSSATNLLGDFMYFVPLISPEPVSVASSAPANQYARLLSFSRNDQSTIFRIKCEFEFVGDGTEQNLID